MDRCLGKHGVVLELRLPQGRCVASNDDKLGLASSQALEGGLVTKSDPRLSVCAAQHGWQAERTCQTS